MSKPFYVTSEVFSLKSQDHTSTLKAIYPMLQYKIIQLELDKKRQDITPWSPPPSAPSHTHKKEEEEKLCPVNFYSL